MVDLLYVAVGYKSHDPCFRKKYISLHRFDLFEISF